MIHPRIFFSMVSLVFNQGWFRGTDSSDAFQGVEYSEWGNEARKDIVELAKQEQFLADHFFLFTEFTHITNYTFNCTYNQHTSAQSGRNQPNPTVFSSHFLPQYHSPQRSGP